MTQTIAYLRVSTIDQDLDKNRADILHLANDKNLGKVKFIQEKVSGSVNWRKRLLGEIIEKELTEGDNLVVSEMSRLGRSMLECMEILAICKDRKINIYTVKGNWELNDSLQSKVMAMAFSIASEIEKDLISKRTKEALAAKKVLGVKLGRPRGNYKSKLDQWKEEIELYLKNGSSQKFLAKKYGCTEATFSYWVKKRGLKIP
jgi:DNA invertase Pin-like site-specific DNA recombinase